MTQGAPAQSVTARREKTLPFTNETSIPPLNQVVMKYYKTDSRKISFREYWHISPQGFWLGWLNKILGRQMNLIRGIPGNAPFKSRIVQPDDLPREILERLNPAIRDLQKLGFDQFWYYSSKQSLTGGLAYGVEGLHFSRQVLAKVIYVTFKSRESFVIALVSGFSNGTALGTSNKKRDFNPAPEHRVQRKVGADAETIFHFHQKELSRLSPGNIPLLFSGLEEVAAFEDKYIQQTYDSKIRRGIWVEMTDAEVAALRVQKGVPPPLPARPRTG